MVRTLCLNQKDSPDFDRNGPGMGPREGGKNGFGGGRLQVLHHQAVDSNTASPPAPSPNGEGSSHRHTLQDGLVL